MSKRTWTVGDYCTMTSDDGFVIFLNEGDPQQRWWDFDDHRQWEIEIPSNIVSLNNYAYVNLATALQFVESRWPHA